ncbi:MAG: metal ABC transporter ATP-binding protein [Chloroflexi bacterium]|nr:metal ABC transporter ATP-binding protein [Chloroflexota bacterium]
MGSAPLLSFEDVSFGYGTRPSVSHVSFNVGEGELVALVGPNGGGKTTLVKLALGLLHPQGGRVVLFGQEVAGFGDWHRVGYVPQRAAGFDNTFPATVAEVVAHGAYKGFAPLAFFRRGVPRSVRDALEAVGLWEQRGQRTGNLSAGQQQRVLIARALVGHPRLLILDEPTAGVDAGAEEHFYAMLRTLVRERGLSILLVTHDIGVVFREASKVACVNGRLVFHGPPGQMPQDTLSALYGVPVNPLEHRHDER